MFFYFKKKLFLAALAGCPTGVIEDGRSRRVHHQTTITAMTGWGRGASAIFPFSATLILGPDRSPAFSSCLFRLLAWTVRLLIFLDFVLRNRVTLPLFPATPEKREQIRKPLHDCPFLLLLLLAMIAPLSSFFFFSGSISSCSPFFFW